MNAGLEKKHSNPELSPTGIAGLDKIICGGLPRDRIYLVQGQPGAGKTTLALQFLIEGIRRKEKCLYVTFSETRKEIFDVAHSHGWDLEGIHLFELSSLEEQLRPETQNTIFHPSEVELNSTTEAVLNHIRKLNPTRVVIDSVSEMRTLAETSIRYRRQMLSLKSFFADKNITVLILDDLTSSKEDLHVQSIVHGVISLEKHQPEFGSERRRLNIAKLRGVNFIGGKHDYVIRPGGVIVYPRLIAAHHVDEFERETCSSGVPEFDRLLDGGLDRGTSNLFMGPAGSGKSTVGAQFLTAAAERGERVAVYLFEENVGTFVGRAKAIGIPIEKHIQSGRISIRKIDPAELTPGEFAAMIQTSVEHEGARTVLIDSLNGYMHAMPEQDFLILQLHELLSYLSHRGVLTLMILAQNGMVGSTRAPIDLTYLADTVIITRFFESKGAVKKAISVVKKRSGDHEETIREFDITKKGIVVGPALTNFQGVLTGVPRLLKKKEASQGA
jgi:circadian clock protein KaiC